MIFRWGLIDKMNGGLGDDRYIVDNESDLVIENSQGGYDKVYCSVNYTTLIMWKN